MNRERMIDFLKYSPDIFDVVIIGGGATGLGAAFDAASRGYRTLLVEQNDFAKATSSRSTKLIHGGLRYLKQGSMKLVKEALHERGLLYKNAPHLVRSLPFVIPTYGWWENSFYKGGLKIYDLLAGELGLEKSKKISREEIIQMFPTLDSTNLNGGVMYHDGQFDDTRLAISLAKSCVDLEGVVINYCKATGFIKKNGKLKGIIVYDEINKEEYRLHAKVIINATGVFSDEIRKLDEPVSAAMIQPSQGIHLVLDPSFLSANKAIIIPNTEDRRVLFFIPWHNRLLIGTTDTEMNTISLEPTPLKEEISFLLKHAEKYLNTVPKESDVLSMFAGLRPLIRENKPTSALSREYKISISSSKLITICGGKWTTYRKMAEEVIDIAIVVGNLKSYPCITHNLKLHGYKEEENPVDSWDIYGSDMKKISKLIYESPELGKPLHPNLPYLLAEVIWAIREEMAEKIEDVLARRTRCLFLDAKASIEAAVSVADLIVQEKGKDQTWKENEIRSFNELAQNYQIQ